MYFVSYGLSLISSFCSGGASGRTITRKRVSYGLSLISSLIKFINNQVQARSRLKSDCRGAFVILQNHTRVLSLCLT